MVSAGYVLPPQCQPIPLDRPAVGRHPAAPIPQQQQQQQRRHSISCSPVHGVLPASAAAAMAAASADAQRVGRKRRFSLPDNGGGLGAGIPLTAFLPSEFKRRRTATTAPSSPAASVVEVVAQTPTLPCISELVQGAAMLAPASATPSAAHMSHPEPCLPLHTAATPDHPRFAPSVTAPAPTPLQHEHNHAHQTQQTVIMPQPVMMTMTHGPIDVAAASQSAFMYGNPGSSSTSPSSSTPSSPRLLGDTPASDLQQAREDAQADKARRAERVAEILDLMDRQNSGAGAVDASTAAFAAAAADADPTSMESWPISASDAAKRRRVGKDQTGILDLMFKVEPMPSQATKKRLADGLGMTYKQVQIWFQNKRARCKRAVEAPPRSSHTFHNMLVSHDGRFMMKELAKAQQQRAQQQNDQTSSANHLYEHHIPSHHEPSAAPPVALRSCILTQ